ncbi:hypothetical protein RhiirC2_795585 [Rhizophagus irregularis]|uniref:Uncharacterized protein n=1 Tax=Rhizophagus irregularis TaxID=588596 RepID=A0A2N1MB95_9GLOM|nr:hypothetical protein RhiirC2_795585 [Rhizophagus irregularis]
MKLQKKLKFQLPILGLCQVSATDSWALLSEFQLLILGLCYVLDFGSWIFDGLRFQIIDFEWVLALVSVSVLGLWIGFSFCSQVFDRFQLPIVFGIQGKCMEVPKYTNAYYLLSQSPWM